MTCAFDVRQRWDRRTLLVAAGGLAAGGAAASEVAPSLKAAAAAAGVVFGSAVRLEALEAQPDLSALVRSACATLTPEVELKWAALSPAPGVLDFAAMDRLADQARAAGQRIRGHTLLWRRSVPPWVRDALAAAPDWALVRRFFASVIPRYGDVIDAWDVVNEPLGPATPEADPFLTAFGAEYVRRALEEARVFAPHARLMLNEYGLESREAPDPDRRTRLLRLAERLKAQGAPLDGVGLQSHLDLRRATEDPAVYAAFLRELAGMGLSIAVTELDVKERDLTAPAAERDRQVAEAVLRHLTLVLAEPGVRAVSTWGLSDRGSWLEVTPEDRAAFPGAWTRGDGPGLNRGLPYDAALRPKPMRDALLAAFAGRPRQHGHIQ